MTLDDTALAQLFFDARTHNAWADRPVADELLQRLYDELDRAAVIYERTRYGFTVAKGDAMAMKATAVIAATKLRKDK